MTKSNAVPISGHGAGAEPSELAAPGHWRFAHALLFTGHMIDAPERRQPRFPASAEESARVAIRQAVASVHNVHAGATVGLAAGASGGDILFHEVCAELGIATRVLLALPAEEFLAASVAPAGPAWVQRFHVLLASHGPEGVFVIGKKDGLLGGNTANVWQRANLWMIEEALALAPERTLLALWDGKTGDGPGGTEHFVQVAQRFGIRVAPHIEIEKLMRG